MNCVSDSERLQEAGLCLGEEEVLDDLRLVEEAKGEALCEEAGNDSGAEGAPGGMFCVEEEWIPHADILDEGVDLPGCDPSRIGLEGLPDSVVFKEPHLDRAGLDG